MKLFHFVLLMVVFTTASFAQNVSVTDYDVPVSSAKILRFNGNWNFAQQNNDVSSTVDNVSSSLSGGLIFKYFYSSLPFAWDIDANANTSKLHGEKFKYDLTVKPGIRKYIWDDKDWFGAAGAEIYHKNSFDKPETYASLGVGYGRYINATALAKTVRIEEHFIREGVINDNMPKVSMIEIAKIIEREDEYKGIYGPTYEAFWYKDIEAVIKETGNLTGATLGAIGLLRMQQVLKGINEIVNDRYYGWDVRASTLFNLSAPFDSLKTKVPQLELGARYSYPITWRSQLNAFTRMRTPVDSNFFKESRMEVGVDYIYELSNRINFVGTYRAVNHTPAVGDSHLNHALDASFVFYLENQIYLVFTNSLIKNDTSKKTNFGSSLTFQYNMF